CQYVHTARERLAARQPQRHHALRITLVGGNRPGFVALDLGNLLAIQMNVKALTELVDDLVLQIEDVRDAAVDLDRLHQTAALDRHQPLRDADLVPEPLIASGDDPAR